jgi:serine protease Do
MPGQEQLPDIFKYFFERQFPQQKPPQKGQAPKARSSGSGFLISKDGYILTNHHVVKDADKIIVALSDRREMEAELVGSDPRSDLALLKIEAEDLPYLTLADSDQLKVGEWVLAIGSPFGLDYSVTAGIVSAKGRSLPTKDNANYVPFIQTDVAINPGNSGGPLFNLDGEVVGVNSQIFTRSGGSIGLSFAIPASVVINVVDQLKEKGRVTRGWFGVTIQDVDKTLADSFGLDRPRGALIAEISPDGPADQAGLLPGDVIISFNGTDVLTSADLPHVVGLIQPGTEVSVELMRDRKRKNLTVEVGGLGSQGSFALNRKSGVDGYGGRLGVLVESAPAETLERWGINGGVIVREVVVGSIAAEAGIIAGDVITLVASSPIKSVGAFEEAVDNLKAGASVPLRLIRRGSPQFIGLKLTE